MKLKNLFFSIAALSVWSFSALAIAPPLSSTTAAVVPSKEISPAAKKQLQIVQMKWFTSLTITDYAKIRGKKLNIFEKAAFKITQYRMKQQLRHDSETTLGDPNWGGLALGFFLSIFGVLLAYIFSTDRDFIKWTWYGFALGLILWLVLIII